ncbi:MAG: hypothetical protein Q9190_002441 [Brigantiaea leucoxantha]
MLHTDLPSLKSRSDNDAKAPKTTPKPFASFTNCDTRTIKYGDDNANKSKLAKKRQSFLPDQGPSIQTINVETAVENYLQPLLGLSDVNPGIRDIESWASMWSTHCNIVKIAQGSYGGVFKLAIRGSEEQYTIGKMIPLRAKSGFGSRTSDFASISDAANEVSMLVRLNDIPGYVEFRSADILQGELPKQLVLASKAFDEASEEDSKHWIAATKNSQQLWLFLEMSDAGTDLEKVFKVGLPEGPFLQSKTESKYLTLQEARDIFWLVAEALAIAEDRASFEHRDLHLGNICVKRLGEPLVDSGDGLVPVTTNLDVTIIDYTLSRAAMNDSATLYNDLSKDPGLFQGKGDIQYDVYRRMNQAVFQGKCKGKNPWAAFVPRTNVLWLHYLLSKLIDRMSPVLQGFENKHLFESMCHLKEEMNSQKKAGCCLISAADVVRRLGRKEDV